MILTGAVNSEWTKAVESLAKTKMFGARFQDRIKEALTTCPKRYQPLQKH